MVEKARKIRCFTWEESPLIGSLGEKPMFSSIVSKSSDLDDKPSGKANSSASLRLSF